MIFLVTCVVNLGEHYRYFDVYGIMVTTHEKKIDLNIIRILSYPENILGQFIQKAN